MSWDPKQLNPTHYRVLVLYWQGRSHGEIAEMCDLGTQQVSNIVCSEKGQEILEELAKRTIDTVVDVQAVLQAYAPIALETKFKLLQSQDDRVRNIAATDILNMSGHQPVRRVVVEKADLIDEAYRDKSLDELRAAVLEKLNYVAPEGPDGTTVH